MTTLTMTKGLPGSGKSTWAKKTVAAAQPGTMVRVNKDDLRGMLHDNVQKGPNERRTVKARDFLVAGFLGQGVSVIVDDTNLNPVHERRLRALAETYGAEFKIADHTAVPLHTCIRQDLKRDRSVGEQVIRGMYDQYLRPAPEEPPAYVDGLPNVVLVDLDGTVAKMADRSPFEWDRVGEDAPHDDVIDLVNTLHDAGAVIVFVSGRDGSAYDQTREWLARYVGEWTREALLLMRPAGDMRKDSIVKGEIYERDIQGQYNVWLVLDDRDQVVQMWRQRGLRVLQVAPGNF
ncbi:AAA family ATPase [Streptomyces sp. NPDC002088]|uniref:phosphatase domain-containing protein n=1 Tax=Streptomyces sp. NPDC002088 TaxID=3154665 RepID=UPI00333162F6